MRKTIHYSLYNEKFVLSVSNRKITILRLLLANLTTSEITEEEAYNTCWQLIVTEQNLGPSCFASSTQNADTTQKTVQMCADDVMVTVIALQACLFNHIYSPVINPLLLCQTHLTCTTKTAVLIFH